MESAAPLLPRRSFARRRLFAGLRRLVRAVLVALQDSRARAARRIIADHRHLLD
ncbi:MAG: hypothetical protein WA418_38275 [Bradyrhizobium sp.]